MLVASATTQESNFVSSFAFQNCDLPFLFSFHSCASVQKSVDAEDIELYRQLDAHKKGFYLLEKCC